MDCRVTVVVDGAPEDAWRAWTEFPRWSEWNPACVEARAETPLRVGSRLDLHLRHPRGRPFYTRPAVSEIDPPRRIAWRARAVGLVAETLVEMEPDGGGTRVTLTASSRGVLGFTYRLMMRPRTQATMFSQMLNGLAGRFRT